MSDAGRSRNAAGLAGAHSTRDRASLAVGHNDVYVAIEDSAGGEIIGICALTWHGDVCELDRLWVVPERIGTGSGMHCSPMRSSAPERREPN